MTKIIRCEGCSYPRPILAKGLCRSCYFKRRRANGKTASAPAEGSTATSLPNPIRRRSAAAKDLGSPKYAQRVVPDKRRRTRDAIMSKEMKGETSDV